ncbi:MAG: prepilin-type N-terminal cleavage/methylation domain-containing protein [Candidatus Omnitrophica bacterium]|nr:prepilin-type N-terminal cleavage/methylation domain-containing protein [Candidatus Omnitrophota bacterium]
MKSRKSGFTLLEIIIVIIIVGVLASLALPRFFSTVEFSRSTEALTAMTAIRQSLERCYNTNNASYERCGLFNNLDLENPTTSPNSHFNYIFNGMTNNTYTIEAQRNAREGGTITDWIRLSQDVNGVTRSGTGAFKGIK